MNGSARVPPPVNEPVLSYAPGTPERTELKAKLAEMSAQVVDIPLIIGGEEILTGNTLDVVIPHDHGHVLARAHRADAEHVRLAMAAAREAHKEWSTMPWEF